MARQVGGFAGRPSGLGGGRRGHAPLTDRRSFGRADRRGAISPRRPTTRCALRGRVRGMGARDFCAKSSSSGAPRAARRKCRGSLRRRAAGAKGRPAVERRSHSARTPPPLATIPSVQRRRDRHVDRHRPGPPGARARLRRRLRAHTRPSLPCVGTRPLRRPPPRTPPLHSNARPRRPPRRRRSSRRRPRKLRDAEAPARDLAPEPTSWGSRRAKDYLPLSFYASSSGFEPLRQQAQAQEPTSSAAKCRGSAMARDRALSGGL